SSRSRFPTSLPELAQISETDRSYRLGGRKDPNLMPKTRPGGGGRAASSGTRGCHLSRQCGYPCPLALLKNCSCSFANWSLGKRGTGRNVNQRGQSHKAELRFIVWLAGTVIPIKVLLIFYEAPVNSMIYRPDAVGCARREDGGHHVPVPTRHKLGEDPCVGRQKTLAAPAPVESRNGRAEVPSECAANLES